MLNTLLTTTTWKPDVLITFQYLIPILIIIGLIANLVSDKNDMIKLYNIIIKILIRYKIIKYRDSK